MPLRDHFCPPVSAKSSWQGFHGGWPMVIVQHLGRVLPDQYVAEPRVNLGNYLEIDVNTDEEDQSAFPSFFDNGGRITTLPWGPPQPTLPIDGDFHDQSEYAVEIYDQSRGRKLVAAVEIVSPANKDRPEARRAFVTKCVALLQQGVCVSIVDLVTSRDFNLYVEVFDELGRVDPAFAEHPPCIYAATCRRRTVQLTDRLESWAYPLVVGEAADIAALVERTVGRRARPRSFV